MTYTLISSVGKGMYKDDGNGPGYRETTYSFPNGKQYTTKLFLEAVFKANYRDITKVILVGTKTSNWDALIDEKADEELWLELIDAKVVENDSELVRRIAEHVEKRFGVQASLIIHTDEIDNSTSHDLFKMYKDIAPRIADDENILFDITHGFRSMPILVYQALQFSVQSKNVELIYGEFNDETKLSLVRNLSPYWKYAQINNALSLFTSKLDGFLLADLLEEDWKAAAKVVRKISYIVQTNFCLQIMDVLRNVRNVLSKDEVQTERPWLSDIRAFLSELASLLEDGSTSRTLYSYACYLSRKNLNTQAVIALQVCVETAVAEKFASEKRIGDYDWWKEYGEPEWKKILDVHSELRNPMHTLRNFRNQVAHGGGKDKDTGAFPLAENTKNIFSKCKEATVIFLKILETS